MLLAAAVSLPAGWFAVVLIERGPGDEPLLRPLRGLAYTRRETLVQSLVSVLFLVMALRFDAVPIAMMLGMLALVTVLVALAFIDIATYRLPDRIVLPMLCGSIVWVAAVSIATGHPEELRGALCGSVVFFSVLFIAHLISPRGMGFGDVKLAALMGLFLGWTTGSVIEAVVLVLWAMLIGFSIGTAAGLVILARRRSNQPFPFGPFLAAGTLLALLARSAILG
jgi:leader peptidase (prepilin peptidase)/N-methyltransferase